MAMTTTWATTQPGAAAARSCFHRPRRGWGTAWAGAGGGTVGAAVLALRVAAVAVDAPGTLMGRPRRAGSRRWVPVEGLVLEAVGAGHHQGLLPGPQGRELGRQHGAPAFQGAVAPGPHQEDLTGPGRRHQAVGEGDGVGLPGGLGVVDPVDEARRAPTRVGDLPDGGVEHPAHARA